jgi:hypothetical protein
MNATLLALRANTNDQVSRFVSGSLHYLKAAITSELQGSDATKV